MGTPAGMGNDRLLNSMLTTTQNEVNDELVNKVMEESNKVSVSTTRRTKKRSRARESYSDRFTGTAKILWKVVTKLAKVSQIECLKMLEEQTNSLPPLPGDFKDLFVALDLIPEHDLRNQHLREICSSVLDDEELYQVISMPLCDGTGAFSLPRDFWNRRAF